MNLYDIFGGEALLKQEYSDFYEALKNAKKIPLEHFAAKAKSRPAELNDDVRIRSLFFKDRKAGVSLCSSYVDKMAAVCAYVDIEDENTEIFGESLTASFDAHTHKYVYLSEKDFPQNKKAIAKAIFAFLDQQGDFYYTEADLSVFNIGEEEIITEAKVPEPKSADGKKTYVSYARTSHFKGINFDYDYPNNHPSGNKVRIMLPFVGSFKVSKEWEILGIETVVEPLPLMNLTFVTGGGTSNYNQDLASKIMIDKSTNTVSWNLAQNSGHDDWGAFAPQTAFGNNTVTDLYSCFAVKLRKIADPRQYYSPVFTVESRASDDHSYGTTVPVKQIQLYLGCFAKETKIKMADGNEKLISEITVGEVVATENGSSAVLDVIVGQEDILVKIETAEGYIMLTDSHPLKTTQGYVRVNELNCGHKLILNGKEIDVKYIYPEKYDDKVYNLVLHDTGGIYANGFIAGDFTMQNELPSEMPIYFQNSTAKSIITQFKELYEKIQKK